MADWPGHFPNAARTVAALVAAGADVDAHVVHGSASRPAATPLHWAASSDDVVMIDALLDAAAAIPAEQITNAFWHACRGGQRATAAYLLGRGADVNWVGHDRKTPYDAARASGSEEVVAWLRTRGAKPAREL